MKIRIIVLIALLAVGACSLRIKMETKNLTPGQEKAEREQKEKGGESEE